jgi:hypothetical protein
MYDVFFYKLYQLLVSHVLEWHALYPLGKVIVATSMNLCPFDDAGCTSPTKSNPHPLKGQVFTIGCNMLAGTGCTSPNRWHASHPLLYQIQSSTIADQYNSALLRVHFIL